MPVPREVSLHNGLFVRMRDEPTFAFAKKLVDLILADPVMLLGIKRGNQDEQMVEKILHARCSSQRDGIVGPFSPFWEFLVERMANRADCVSQRLEECANQAFAGSARDYRKLSAEWDQL